MNVFNFFFFFILINSGYPDFTEASQNPKIFLKNINKNKNSLNRTLLVQNKNNIKTIIVSGKGKSEEKAAMNAAQNALLMASPRYIKKRRINLYKETSINGKLIPEETINSYRESSYGFNQGTLLSFKVTKTYFENNIYSVVAIAKVSYGLNDQEYHPLFKPLEVNTKEVGTQKIFKIGTGRSEEEAIKDSIEQALMFVVGEKINVEVNFDKIEQINYFIDKEMVKEDFYTKETLDDLTIGFSEGYIESFNKLNSYEEDGLYKVEADIVVRMKSFSSYVDEKLKPTGLKIND